MIPESDAEPAIAHPEAESTVALETAAGIPPAPIKVEPAETRFLKWVMFGSTGVRVGWLVGLFLSLSFLFTPLFAAIAVYTIRNLPYAHADKNSAARAILGETVSMLAILGAGAVCAAIEGRRIRDYYLGGSRRALRFVGGAVAGVVALSALIGALYEGHWIRFGSVALSGTQIWKYAVLWGLAFVLTGLVEEGSVRCYMLFTLERGINYWWALGTVASLSLFAAINPSGNGSGGVYLMAGLGVLPCLWLFWKKSPSAGFWEAAWLTSTFFGYIHTFNEGESWMGIFSTAIIGLVFCVSVRLTGSVWWAFGFHASWDWAQSFFYGTADSGTIAEGHYLTTNPVGALLWSGGEDGPEGSLLVIPIVLLVLLGLILVYRRRKPELEPIPSQEQLAA